MVTKEDILALIKESADENGGIPLGQEKFANETGIKTYHWSKYWSKFSDPQREAGLLSNSFNSAYSDQFLFDKYIALMRELGHYPTKLELRVKKSSDLDFPSPNTFDRLGNKKDLAKKILQYAENQQY